MTIVVCFSCAGAALVAAGIMFGATGLADVDTALWIGRLALGIVCGYGVARFAMDRGPRDPVVVEVGHKFTVRSEEDARMQLGALCAESGKALEGSAEWNPDGTGVVTIARVIDLPIRRQ